MPPRYPAGPRSQPRSLREACRKAGLDEDGERCADCPLKQLCESEARWLICRNEKPGYLN